MRAVGEPTRMRLLALLARNELTVSELTRISGLSQPRISRHLKLMCEAGLLDRYQEGTWVLYRLADGCVNGHGENDLGAVARKLAELIPGDDPLLVRDSEKLAQVKAERGQAAIAHFDQIAGRWDEIRALHVSDTAVEQAMLEMAGLDSGNLNVGDMLDVGTGTARVLEIFAPYIRRGVGIDFSREMLAIARANIEQANLTGDLGNLQVRHGDMYSLPLADSSFDLITFHQVLHFADRPGAALAEAARVLRQRGRMMVVDFASHDLEYLRDDHAHNRLGFSDQAVQGWFRDAGLTPGAVQSFPGGELTVKIWLADRL